MPAEVAVAVAAREQDASAFKAATNSEEATVLVFYI